tara:strand:- start:26 stop:523 length:498 start_codon:yes stop_codon:yes gene_type:complete
MRNEWKSYTEDLIIPKYWRNISYNNDTLPSYSSMGYQIWIDSHSLKQRVINAKDRGFTTLSNTEFEKILEIGHPITETIYNKLPLRFAVTYLEDTTASYDFLFESNDFNEIKEFVKAPDFECIRGLLISEMGIDINDWVNGMPDHLYFLTKAYKKFVKGKEVKDV